MNTLGLRVSPPPRLLVVLLLHIVFFLIILLTCKLPQDLKIDIQKRFHTFRNASSLITSAPSIAEPSPDWLLDALEDDLPCIKLPPPSLDGRRGYSYPPSTSDRHQASRSNYLLFQHQPRGSDTPTLSTGLTVPESCIDSTIADGTLCNSAQTPNMDVIWTFANGSGVLHEKWRRVRQVQQRLERAGTLAPRARVSIDRVGTELKLFRDHDELRHSMRSVLQHFRPYTNQFYLLTGDFAFPSCDPDEYAGWRLGQVPQWLDVREPSEWQDGDVRLDVVHHAQFFSKEYKYTTFNSLAIESQFARLNVSDVFIYLNDDTYFSADLSPWDFYTPSFGLVLRMQPDLVVQSRNVAASPQRGEWQSLEFSNWLLSIRFGERHRPYVTHEAKGFKRSILTELSLIWSPELAATSSHPFRADPLLHDTHTGFIAAHFMVERWREGLLWSWIVARLGSAHDEWNTTTSEMAWLELGGELDMEDMRLRIKIPERDTLSKERLDKAANAILGNQTTTRRTNYTFSSQDGYPYTFLGSYGSYRWPQYPSPMLQCEIAFEKCFPTGLTSASDMFKHIAFATPRCGDCIIHALVGASGPLGLSAFLPDATHSSDSQGSHGPVPHLPLVSDYRTGDFSLQAVLGNSTTDVRGWVVRMLQRYRFVLGNTPSLFAMIVDGDSAENAFDKINADSSIALVCLNDDLSRYYAEEGDIILRREQELRWPYPAAWEMR